MLTAFLFIILLGIPLFIYFYFSSKISNQKKQLIMLLRQNSDLRNKLNSQPKIPLTVNVKYKTPSSKNCVVRESCNLYLAPLDISPILIKMSKDTILELEDSAEIQGILWYEVSILLNDRLNSKGWVKGDTIEVAAINDSNDLPC